MSRVFPKVVSLMGAVLLLTLPAPGRAAVQPAEYMIYQYPGVALVVKVDVPEAEFSMRILGPDDALLAEAGVPGRRLGPVFQYLAPADLPRQLMIEVTPGRPLPRSAIIMQLIQLEPDNPNAGALSRAYRQFSSGTETARGSDTNTWVVKTYSLRSAAQSFADLGMEQMRLWSDYFAAHLVLHRLGDALTARELARAIRLDAVRAGFDRVELAALVLEGDALMQLAGAGESAESQRFFEQAGAVFPQIADLADKQQLRVEQSRALYHDGQVLESEGRSEAALEMYSRAIDICANAGDADLLAELRNASAALQESLGQTGGAIEMLDQLAAELEQGGEDDVTLDLANGLFEKGRLLNESYRYAEAAAELARALELRKASAQPGSWGPTGLELAWSLYSMGDAGRAVDLIEESLPRTSPRDHPELVTRAWASLARIHRAHGEFGAAAEARQRQQASTGSGAAEALLLLDMAADARAQYGPASTQARDLLVRSRRSAAAAGDVLTEQRAALQLCVLASAGAGQSACPPTEVDAYYRALREAGMPKVAMEAALARAELLRSQGRTAAAWLEMNGLIEDLFWLRQALPGVLGAWYEEGREDMFRDYLSLSVVAAGTAPRGGQGSLPLLALERVRTLEATGVTAADHRYIDADSDEKLRSLLWRREAAARAGKADWTTQARQALAAARQGCAGCSDPGRDLMSEEQIDSLLGGLQRNEAVLAYDFSGPRGRALLAERRGVRVLELSPSADLGERLAALREELVRHAGSVMQSHLDDLGQRLLAPLADRLPASIYLLPTGALRGIPFDALRLRGNFLAEQHQVVNLAGLAALVRTRTAMPADYRDRVFLAGDPRRERDPFSLEVIISPEVSAVTDTFVGPGLHVVQGLALQKDEFDDERFTRAALIHLAAPGRMDLALPERSSLTLSGGTGAGPDNTLSPAEIRNFGLEASLLVLSRTVVVGDSVAAMGSRMPLVSDFLDAGAGSVLASLWPVGEAEAASFAGAFYRNLGQQPDIRSAFTATRRSFMVSGAATNFETWAGFQLFIR